MADDAEIIEQLRAENAALRKREAVAIEHAVCAKSALAEALEQQTATAEVLRVIASSPTDLQQVLDAIVTSAARITDAARAAVWRTDGDVLRCAALFGAFPDERAVFTNQERPLDGSTNVARAVLER